MADGGAQSQVVVVTGSTRGIGRGLVREFLRMGHRVVVTGRSQEAVARAVAELGTPDRVQGCVCDVRSLDSIRGVWDAAVARFGRVDCWINNAAVATDHELLGDLPADQVRATVETNFLGTVYGIQVPLAGMLRQGGGRIYTFEGFGSNGMTSPGLAIYGATKSAITYLTKALAKEYKDAPVLIGALSPGIVPTDLLVYSSRSRDRAQWERAKRTMNILGDKVETVTPWLAQAALANTKQGATLAWLTPGKAALRFAFAPFRRRDIISEFEAQGDPVVR